MNVAEASVAHLARLLQKSPAGQQLIAQDAADRRRARQEHIAALQSLAKKAPPELAKRRRVVEQAQERRLATAEAARVAERESLNAVADLMGCSSRFENERAKHEQALIASANPVIAEAIERLRAEQIRLRKEPVESIAAKGVDERGRDKRTVRTNRPLILERMKAVQSGIGEVEALRLVDLDDAQIEKRLAAVWQSLPGTAIE
jgi:hypothetical protein